MGGEASRQMKKVKWSGIVLALLAVGLALGVQAPGAQAHAFLAKSQPADGQTVQRSPIEILMWFTEDLDMTYSKAQVLDVNSKRWDADYGFHIHSDAKNPGIILQPSVPDGTYTVVWDVLSATDGHRTKGSFTYYVGQPTAGASTNNQQVSLDTGSAPPRWLQVSVRWVNFTLMAVLIGASLFPFLILPAGLARLKGEKRDSSAAMRRAVAAARITAVVACSLLVLGALAALWVQVWSAGGSATSTSIVSNVINHTRFGGIWLARLTIIGAALVCALLVTRQKLESFKPSIMEGSNSAWLLLVGLALGLPATTSLNSHAAAGSSSGFQTAVDWVHLVAGGIWIGGLVQFLLTIALVSRLLKDRAGFIAGLVRRFSTVAVPCVGVIVFTGIIQSIDRLGGVSELVNSGYGATLAVKIGLLLPLIALGAYNLLVTGPRFLSLAREHTADLLERLYEGRFRRALAMEIALAAAILVVTAVLTNSSPPGPALGSQPSGVPTPVAGAGGVSKGTAGDLEIQLWSDQAKVGANDINVHIVDQDGDPKPILRVIVRPTLKGGALGTSEVDALDAGGGVHFIAPGVQLGLPGEYDVQIVIRREGVLDETLTLPLQIAA